MLNASRDFILHSLFYDLMKEARLSKRDRDMNKTGVKRHAIKNVSCTNTHTQPSHDKNLNLEYSLR